MMILALDTSGHACSAALYDQQQIREQFTVQPRQQARLTLPQIEQLLHEAGVAVQQLDAIAFARGPGSFTGVRIAASITQGIAFAHDLPVIPVSTLQALAAGAKRQYQADCVLTAMDARMQQVYWGAWQYQQQQWQAMTDEMVIDPDAVTLPTEQSWLAVGDGWQQYPQLLQAERQQIQYVDWLHCHAQDVLSLAITAFQQGNMVPAEQALPVYLRDKVTHN